MEKVALWLEIADCHSCPYLDVDYNTEEVYWCRHPKRKVDHRITKSVEIGSYEECRFVLADQADIAETCPLKELLKK